jgi:hypothetical protein
LLLAFKLGVNTGNLACTTGGVQRPWERSVPARDIAAVREESAPAKRRFGGPEAARVGSCDEAGRDGCWRHRAVVAQGVENVARRTPDAESGSLHVLNQRGSSRLHTLVKCS